MGMTAGRGTYAAFWAAAAATAAAGFAALWLSTPRGERNDRLTIVDWKASLDAGKIQEHDFVVYADERAWIELHVDAPPSGAGVDVRLFRGDRPVPELSAEAVLGRRELAGTLSGDVYKLALRSPGPAAAVRVQVVRDYAK